MQIDVSSHKKKLRFLGCVFATRFRVRRPSNINLEQEDIDRQTQEKCLEAHFSSSAGEKRSKTNSLWRIISFFFASRSLLEEVALLCQQTAVPFTNWKQVGNGISSLFHRKLCGMKKRKIKKSEITARIREKSERTVRSDFTHFPSKVNK